MSSFRRRMMMAAKQGRILPSEYQLLPYIVIGGSTCFKTGFIPTTMCRVELTFKGVASNSSIAGIYFGCREGYNNKSFYFCGRASSGSATSITAELGWNTIRTVSANVDAHDKNTIGVHNGEFYINDTILATYTNTFSPTRELYLFALNNAGSKFTSISTPNGYFYSSQIWDNDGNLIRDYVPVKRLSDNRKGIYDFVNNTFTTSS